MNNETRFVIDYFQRHSEFIEAIKRLPKHEKIRFMKKNLEPDVDAQLTQVQCNLFHAAMYHVEWDIVIQELDGDRGIDSNDGN